MSSLKSSPTIAIRGGTICKCDRTAKLSGKLSRFCWCRNKLFYLLRLQVMMTEFFSLFITSVLSQYFCFQSRIIDWWVTSTLPVVILIKIIVESLMKIKRKVGIVIKIENVIEKVFCFAFKYRVFFHSFPVEIFPSHSLNCGKPHQKGIYVLFFQSVREPHLFQWHSKVSIIISSRLL